MADFCHTSQRLLSPFDYQIFRYHHLLGADWKLCCRQFKMNRGAFWNAVRRIEETLGRAFRELKPYSLYPVDEYFGSVRRTGVDIRPVTPARCGPLPLRPPLAARPVAATLEGRAA